MRSIKEIAMDAEIKTKWVEALRSGKYEQTRHTVRDHRGFCCLGVLCDIAGATWKTDEACEFYVEYDCDQSVTGTPETLDLAIGLGESGRDAVMRMNDADEKSFAEIADYIEQNL
jgi:hypothetical protein